MYSNFFISNRAFYRRGIEQTRIPVDQKNNVELSYIIYH